MQPASAGYAFTHAEGVAGSLPLERDALRLAALGLMTAGIVHDLGNMVQVLSSAINILERHPGVRAAEGLQPVMSSAVSSLERAKGLIRQILGFARGDAEDDESLDVTLCVAGMERLLRWIAPDGVALHLSLAPNAPRLRCNRRDFENALLNLLLNACDAMPEGGAVSISAALDAGRDLVVSVTDTGEGMSPDVVARACDPFFTTRTPGQGNGLGLAMVRRFVHAAGGGMAIHSRLGLGTAVTLRFPAASAPASVT